jgi:hypothetical protein
MSARDEGEYIWLITFWKSTRREREIYCQKISIIVRSQVEAGNHGKILTKRPLKHSLRT